ncbi:condensation domain-containing protein [Catellatospora chokoriensis]|uniref:Condensation domain-containing protein n=1 Tax=Catellatospora chokoriensis TaxID=310353 RepID=A0A8J3NR24_9ACTN|nr:condensation domain-containing protein [Catellatospora chokoriensis]GIF87665.1 hypothetical protein Cch02nite_11090 [Catellatospora chokoriensis]
MPALVSGSSAAEEAVQVPLSFTQRYRLAHNAVWQATGRLGGGSVMRLLAINGDFDAVRLGLALQDVLERHPALRTILDPKTATASLAGPLPPPVREVDGRSMPRAELDTLFRDEWGREFDVTTGPNFRALVVRTTTDTWCLAITAKHFFVDGTSMRILLNDLGQAYAARETGPTVWRRAAEPAGSYAEWEQTTLTGEELARRLGHWRTRVDPLQILPEFRLAGAAEPPPGRRTAAEENRALDVDESRALFTACARLEVTPYAVFAAALAAAMHADGGLRAPGLVSPLSIRPPRWRHTVGWFTRVTPLRVEIEPGEDLGTLARRWQAETAAAMEHSLPVTVLARSLVPGRRPVSGWRPQVYLDIDYPEAVESGLGDRIQLGGVGPTLRDGLSAVVRCGGRETQLTVRYESESVEASVVGQFLGAVMANVRAML